MFLPALRTYRDRQALRDELRGGKASDVSSALCAG